MIPPRSAPALMGVTALSAMTALAALALAACSEGEAPQPGAAGLEAVTTVEDSAGIRIVTTAVTPETPHWRVPSEPELQLGAVEGAPAHLFQRPEFAARLENGTVVVADFGSGQLRFFDADGAHLTSVGGRGQGPGEFQEFNRVVRAEGDTLFVYDFRNRRVTRIAPDGSRAGDASLNAPISVLWQGGVRPFEKNQFQIVGPPDAREIQRWRNLNFAGPASWDAHVIAFNRRTEMPERSRDTIRDVIEVVRVEPGRDEGQRLGSVAGPLVLPMWMDGRERGVGWVPLRRPVPFAGEAHVAIGGGRVILSRGDRYELQVVDAVQGDLTLIRRRDLEPHFVDEALRDRFVSWRIGRPGSFVEEGERQEAAAAFEILGDAHRLPTHAEVFLDDEGRIWVQDWSLPWDEGEPATFTVFGEDGAIVATATLPGDLSVTHIGREHVTGVVWDELGIEYVRVYSIVRNDGPR